LAIERIEHSGKRIEPIVERILRSEELIKLSAGRIELSRYCIIPMERTELSRYCIIPMERIERFTERIERSMERITLKFIVEHKLIKDIKS
jgi:hypothetical protein